MSDGNDLDQERWRLNAENFPNQGTQGDIRMGI